MHMQKEIMTTLHVKPEIDPEEEIRKRIDFLKAYLLITGAKGFVLGISGGQDSTLAGKLAQMAVEELRDDGHDAIFVAIRLPYGTQKDEEDAQMAIDFIQPDETHVFDIQPAVDALVDSYQRVTDSPLSDYQKGNVKARMRMIVQYAFGGMRNLLVIGTDHAAEAVTGYYTKYGDGGSDLLPLAGLTKRQGQALLKALNARKELYLKVPTADLLDENPLKADEAELGMSYEELDDYLEGKQVSEEIAKKIEAIYRRSMHKRHTPATMFDDWWKR